MRHLNNIYISLLLGFILLACEQKQPSEAKPRKLYIKESAMSEGVMTVPGKLGATDSYRYNAATSKFEIPITVFRIGDLPAEELTVTLKVASETVSTTNLLPSEAYELPGSVTLAAGENEQETLLIVDADFLQKNRNSNYSLTIALEQPSVNYFDEKFKTLQIRINSKGLLEKENLNYEWIVVFEDNFDGNSVNTANWGMYYSAGHAGNGLRRPEAFSVADGNLIITAQMKDGVLVSGGMAHRKNYTYGRFEFRVRTEPDPSQAVSGVVLTWPQSGRWPIDGENDIYETMTKPDRSTFNTFIHYGAGVGKEYDKHYSFLHQARADEWQVMMMEWTENDLKIYRNGLMVWEIPDKTVIPKTAHHICLQLDAFKTVMGNPVKMYVDWVRIYQQQTD